MRTKIIETRLVRWSQIFLEIRIFRISPLASWPWLKLSATAHQLSQRCHQTLEKNKDKNKMKLFFFETINNFFRRRHHTQESRIRRVTISFYCITLLVCFMWEFGPNSTCPKPRSRRATNCPLSSQGCHLTNHQFALIFPEMSSDPREIQN